MNRVLLCMLLSTWLFAVCLVDFAVLPSVFSNVDDILVGGKIGVHLFGIFNPIEILLGVLIGFLSLLFLKSHNLVFAKMGFGLSLFLILIPLYQTFIVSSGLEDSLNKMLTFGPGHIHFHSAYDSQASYHKIYIITDSIKLFVLGVMIMIYLYLGKRLKK